MREATIILPQDHPSALTFLRTELLNAFGGYTEHEATGAWRDDNTGKVYYDHNAVFTVAAEDTEHNRQMVRVAAQAAGFLAEQVTVYTRDFDGEVAIEPCNKGAQAVYA